MRLSLSESQAIHELAEHLYDFIPGKAHPFGDQSLSFEGIARSIGIGELWQGGSKLPAIESLLTQTLSDKRGKFCTLIVEVIRASMKYTGFELTREKMDRLNKLVAQVGFKIPELHDRGFLEGLPKEQPDNQETASVQVVPEAKIEELKNRLPSLLGLSPTERGFEFERFLQELFEVHGLIPKKPFRITGEQIDGSIHIDSDTYLIEATWTNEQVGASKLNDFYAKVSSKATWSRGLLISYSGFTADGLEAFIRGKPTSIICMDGLDIHYILDNKLDLKEAIARKARVAAETNQAFIPVRELP